MASMLRVAGFMLLVALVMGTATSAAATERVTVGLVVEGVVGWGFVPVLQLLTGFLLVQGTGGQRTVKLERYFATHWPWSLWIIGYHALLLAIPLRSVGTWVAITGVVPMAVTMKLLSRFARAELGLAAGAARWRVGVHQAVTYAIVAGYLAVGVALWTRVLKVLA